MKGGDEEWRVLFCTLGMLRGGRLEKQASKCMDLSCAASFSADRSPFRVYVFLAMVAPLASLLLIPQAPSLPPTPPFPSPPFSSPCPPPPLWFSEQDPRLAKVLDLVLISSGIKAHIGELHGHTCIWFSKSSLFER